MVDEKLKNLIEVLKEAELDNEAEELNLLLSKNAAKGDPQIELWAAVSEEVSKRRPPQAPGRAIRWIVSSAQKLQEVGNATKGASKEELEAAVSIAEKAPSFASISYGDLIKFSTTDFSKIDSKEFVKTAGPLSWVGSLGKGVAKGLPYVGAIFSFLLACKNAYYGFLEYKRLVSDADKIGLSWIDTLTPRKLESKVIDFWDKPKDMLILTQTTRTAKVFIDEGISLLANSIDFIKDLIFIVINIMTAGISGWLDFAISMFIWLIEVSVESELLGAYDPVLSDIKSRAESAIKNLMMGHEEAVDEFDIESWWERL